MDRPREQHVQVRMTPQDVLFHRNCVVIHCLVASSGTTFARKIWHKLSMLEMTVGLPSCRAISCLPLTLRTLTGCYEILSNALAVMESVCA